MQETCLCKLFQVLQRSKTEFHLLNFIFLFRSVTKIYISQKKHWRMKGGRSQLSKFLALKADTQYFLEKFKTKISFEKILNKLPKQHRQQVQDHKMII